MKKSLIFFMIILSSTLIYSQKSSSESLRLSLNELTDDSTKVNTLIELSSNYYRVSADSAIYYGGLALELAEKINFINGQAYALKSIGMGHYFKGNFIDALVTWQQSLNTFQSINDRLGVANMLNNLGAVHFNQGDDAKAIEYYLESLRVSEELNDTLRIVTANVNIGAVYINKEATYDLALKYYLQSLPLSEIIGDHDAIGTCTVNMGEIYLARRKPDSALIYFEKALDAYQKSTFGNTAYALNSIGKAYAMLNNFEIAIDYQNQAYITAKSNDSKLEMSQSLLGLANTYKQNGDISSAILNFQEALSIANEINAIYQAKDAYQGLAECYSDVKDFQSAYKYQNLYSDLKDTLYNAEMDKRLQALTLNFDINKKQGQINLLTKDKAIQDLELRRQRILKNAVGITGIFLFILALGLFNRYKYVHKTKKIIEGEKALSEKLLLNILPHETAAELKEKGFATPKYYEKVSVLFTDFKGFTKIAENLTPHELVEELNQCFMEFDKIIDKHHLEKIKTIGDAYMCAGGIPAANETNPYDVVLAGLEIKQYMEKLKIEREARGESYWELRIGIHTGSVIAGVIGKNKFAYDIWGDAVNTASRMESSGIPGIVNISGDTYHFIKDDFNCVYRGKVHAKNKGDVDMYIVEGLKSQPEKKPNEVSMQSV